MRTSPSLLPRRPDHDTYLVLDDFGRKGRRWRKTVEDTTDRETLIRDLVDGKLKNPVRIVVFNTAEGWSLDVTVDIADEIHHRVVGLRREISESAIRFMDDNRRRTIGEVLRSWIPGGP
jgi:hypothetical protein